MLMSATTATTTTTETIAAATTTTTPVATATPAAITTTTTTTTTPAEFIRCRGSSLPCRRTWRTMTAEYLRSGLKTSTPTLLLRGHLRGPGEEEEEEGGEEVEVVVVEAIDCSIQ